MRNVPHIMQLTEVASITQLPHLYLHHNKELKTKALLEIKKALLDFKRTGTIHC